MDQQKVAFHGFPSEADAQAAKQFLQLTTSVPIWVAPCEVTPEMPFHLCSRPEDARGLYVRTRYYLESKEVAA